MRNGTDFTEQDVTLWQNNVTERILGSGQYPTLIELIQHCTQQIFEQSGTFYILDQDNKVI